MRHVSHGMEGINHQVESLNVRRSSISTAETPAAKRMKTEPRQLRIPSSATAQGTTTSPSQDGTGLLEKAKNLFHGKLGLAEVQSILDLLIRYGHGDCIHLIIEDLNTDLVSNLVMHTLTHSTVRIHLDP